MVKVVLVGDQVLVSDVGDYVKWGENGKDNDFYFLEEEFHDHLQGFDFVEFQVVLVEDREQELFADRFSKYPANSEADYIDGVALIALLLVHAIPEELLVNINGWRGGHCYNPVIQRGGNFENLLFLHLICLHWELFKVVWETVHIYQIRQNATEISTSVEVDLGHVVQNDVNRPLITGCFSFVEG